jgi:hypothetical protein
MSLPNSLALHATHSCQGSHGGRPGSGLSNSVSTCHSPHLGQCSAGVLHVASGATTRQGRGAGKVSPMTYSTPARSLTFSNFVTMSQGHSVSSLSQSQSTLATKRKGDSCPQKGNAAKRRGASRIPMMAPDTRLRQGGVPRLIPRMMPNTHRKCAFWNEAAREEILG